MQRSWQQEASCDGIHFSSMAKYILKNCLSCKMKLENFSQKLSTEFKVFLLSFINSNLNFELMKFSVSVNYIKYYKILF